MIASKRIGLVRDQRGVALIEFVLVFPLLLLLLFGCVELSRYLMVHLKVQSASYAMANIVTQYQAATPKLASGEINYAQLTGALGGDQLKHMLAPFGNDLSREGVIVTSIRKQSPSVPGTVIKWQIFTAGSITGVESIVNQKTPVSISNVAGFVQDRPTTFDGTIYPGFSSANLASMFVGENMIVVEVFYRYDPLYTSVFNAIGITHPAFAFPGLTPQTVTRHVVMRPRSGDLICLPGAGSAFLYPECS